MPHRYAFPVITLRTWLAILSDCPTRIAAQRALAESVLGGDQVVGGTPGRRALNVLCKRRRNSGLNTQRRGPGSERPSISAIEVEDLGITLRRGFPRKKVRGLEGQRHRRTRRRDFLRGGRRRLSSRSYRSS